MAQIPKVSFLFFFLDGVGLGADDPDTNPFARASMPKLQELLGGRRLIQAALNGHDSQGRDGGFRFPVVETQRASLLALDAGLGVAGLPQSATGQTVLLTGENAPAKLGYHYGPKPNQQVAEFLKGENLFKVVRHRGGRSGLLNAYPPRYFEAIQSGRRIYSAVPQAVIEAGLSLRTSADLEAGTALSADFTAEGWRENLGLPDTPLLTPHQAGQRLAELAQGYDFAFFEYWLTDYAGHAQEMETAVKLLERFDRVLGGLLDTWVDQRGLILLTSDHGNLEDLSTRRHTANPVPALLIGSAALRRAFIQALAAPPDLAGIAPAVLEVLGGKESTAAG